MDVVVESAMRQTDGAVILANSKMAEAGEGLYEIDMLAAKPGDDISIMCEAEQTKKKHFYCSRFII